MANKINSDGVQNRNVLKYLVSSVEYVHELDVFLPWLSKANYTVMVNGVPHYCVVEILSDTDKFVTFRININTTIGAMESSHLIYTYHNNTVILPIISPVDGQVEVFKALNVPTTTMSYIKIRIAGSHLLGRGVLSGNLIADAVSMSSSTLLRDGKMGASDYKCSNDIYAVVMALISLTTAEFENSQIVHDRTTSSFL